MDESDLHMNRLQERLLRTSSDLVNIQRKLESQDVPEWKKSNLRDDQHLKLAAIEEIRAQLNPLSVQVTDNKIVIREPSMQEL